MRAVPNGSYDVLGRFIKERVVPGSIVITDDWTGYAPLSRDGYQHRVVDTEQGLRVIHHVFANLKAWINGTHKHVSKKHAQTYLNEFCYRYNGRMNKASTFERIMRLLASRTGPTQEQLKRAGKRGGWLHWNPPMT
jgi:transposase-like protein